MDVLDTEVLDEGGEDSLAFVSRWLSSVYMDSCLIPHRTQLHRAQVSVALRLTREGILVFHPPLMIADVAG